MRSWDQDLEHAVAPKELDELSVPDIEAERVRAVRVFEKFPLQFLRQRGHLRWQLDRLPPELGRRGKHGGRDQVPAV